MIFNFDDSNVLLDIDIYTNIFYLKSKSIIHAFDINLYERYQTNNKFLNNFNCSVDTYIYTGDFYEKSEDDFYIYKIKFYNPIYINNIYVLYDEEDIEDNVLILEYDPIDTNIDEIYDYIKIKQLIILLDEENFGINNFDNMNIDNIKFLYYKKIDEEDNKIYMDDNFNKKLIEYEFDYKYEIKSLKHIDKDRYKNTTEFYLKITFEDELILPDKIKIYYNNLEKSVILDSKSNTNVEYIKVL